MSKPSKRWTKVQTPRSEPEDPKVDFPSLESLEALARTLDGISPESENLNQAEMVALDAMMAPNRRKRISLSQDAIKISPLCGDAYITLGRETKDAEGALAFYKHAFNVGQLVVNGMEVEEDSGEFWGLIETRPYMRAQQMLALTLWDLGRQEEAIQHFQELIQRNPGDNQGIRYLLLDALLIYGPDEAASELLRLYKDDWSASWTWSTALMEFRTGGDNEKARLALSAAHAYNSHVKGYLIDEKRLPVRLPDLIGLGDESEAQSYVHGAKPAWAATEGVIEWVKATFESGLPEAVKPTLFGEPDLRPLFEPIAIPADVEGRIEAAALAMLYLGLHEVYRTWKSFDFDVMDRLFEKGMITNPATKAKSVMFTADGLERAEQLYEQLFVQGRLGEADPLGAIHSETAEPD